MSAVIRHDWSAEELHALFDLPLPELLYRAASVHRQHFDPAEIQVSTLLSVKTGGCPEDCAYCPQAQRYNTGVTAQKLMDVDAVVAKARQAKLAGASRFCMGAAWRSQGSGYPQNCGDDPGGESTWPGNLCHVRHA